LILGSTLMQHPSSGLGAQTKMAAQGPPHLVTVVL
jgi:hypothetical protein